jgi:hypothetical protein
LWARFLFAEFPGRTVRNVLQKATIHTCELRNFTSPLMLTNSQQLAVSRLPKKFLILAAQRFITEFTTAHNLPVL